MSVLGRVLADIKDWLVSQHHPPPSGPGQSAHSLCSFLPALKGFPQSSARRQLGWPQRRGKQRQKKAETQRNQEKENEKSGESEGKDRTRERNRQRDQETEDRVCVSETAQERQSDRSHPHTHIRTRRKQAQGEDVREQVRAHRCSGAPAPRPQSRLSSLPHNP